jgi:hypothetical protein
MSKSFGAALAACCLIGVSLVCGGCSGEPEGAQPGATEVQPGMAPAPPAGPVSTSSRGIRRIMGRLTKGQSSLTEVIGKELKEATPAWETIQGQTKEYVQLVGEMTKYDPPKGTKESWTDLTAAYAESAGDLDKAAQAKDQSAALAAHGEIKNSCMGCHRQHRTMGPGGPGGPGFGGRPGGFPGMRKGGFGGPPPGGPPPGGPPPESPAPGGPPPGDPPPRDASSSAPHGEGAGSS